MEVEQKKRKPREVPKIRKKKQPSVAEVERAIGAGIFRDRDPRFTASYCHIPKLKTS